MTRVFLTLVPCILTLALFSSCGNESSVSDEAILLDETLGELDATEQLITSDVYDGKLIVHLKAETGDTGSETGKAGFRTKALRNDMTRLRNDMTRLRDDNRESFGDDNDLTTSRSQISNLKSVVDAHPSAILKKSIEIEPEKLDARRKQLEKLSGETLEDWNSVYRIEVSDGTEAVKIYRELKSRAEVKMVYPKLKHMLLSLATTPDLTGVQGYLYDDATHGGVNAPAAWNAGITGQGAVLFDGEAGWNYDHEDLPRNLNRIMNGTECLPSSMYRECWKSVNHGTGISGILGGVPNEHGVTGIAHGAEIYAMDYSGEDLAYLTDGVGYDINEELPPGSILVVELGAYGALSVPSADTQYGGLPSETYPISFAAVKQATAAGITIIEASGNGSISLNDPNVYLPWQVNLSLPENDTNSTLVGSSMGISHQKRVDSNCSPRIDTYSWGEGVVTAGFPYQNSPYVWTPISGGPNPPNDDPNSYFINNFGGTSSAAAIVGGAAALIQSYAKREIGQGETRYLMPLKMREILANSGSSQAPVPAGAPYQVCQTPGGLHVGAGNCPTGKACMAYEPNMAEYTCSRDSDCYGYGTYFTLSAQCINGYCGMSWCAPKCSEVAGGCASMGWYETTPGSSCRCRPPYGTYEMNNCNIGKQPKVDVAMPLVDQFLDEVKQEYPEIENNTSLTEQRMIELRDMGLGIICKPADIELHRPGQGDPSCPESELWPTGNYIAKDLDFDGDGRADLVQWTNGSWKLDLSSRCAEGATCGEDNFGAWDIEIIHPPIVSKWVWPYVEDMNSDGREDFVEYDKEHGKWFIAFTDDRLLKQGLWHGWNYVIDYGSQWKDDLKMDPLKCTESETPGTGENCSNYSRPAPGDYDGDGWVDLAVACSDGNWRIDFGGGTRADFGTYERTIKYLTDDQLRAAPGWAYPTTKITFGENRVFLAFKTPDGLNSSDDGRLFTFYPEEPSSDWMYDSSHIYGGNDAIVMSGSFCFQDAESDLSIKYNDGLWKMTELRWYKLPTLEWSEIFPYNDWGQGDCAPFVADFDGNGWSDRAVMCSNEWRISYSNGINCSEPQSNIVRIPFASSKPRYFSLPGRSYSGGVSYGNVQRMIKFYQRMNPTEPSPIPVDMPSVGSN